MVIARPFFHDDSAAAAASSSAVGAAPAARSVEPVAASVVCCAAAGAASASSAISAVAVRSVRVMIVSSRKNAIVDEYVGASAYVFGVARTTSKVTVTFGSVFSMPSMAVGGLTP